MQRNLIMKERIQGLRKDRKLTLEDVVKGTGIPKATLNRLEFDSPDLNKQETRVGYQDIITLAKFYGVSTDYLCGLTENLTPRNVEIDKLRLSNEAIAELVSGKLNTRLLSEIIVHPDFAGLLAALEALEVYIDRTISEKIEATNKMLDIAVGLITKKTNTVEPDEYITAMTEGKIDPDDYLRFRLSQRFEKIAWSLYEAHAIETQDETGRCLIFSTSN